MTLVFVVLLFFINGIVPYALAIAYTIALIAACKVSPKRILSGIKGIAFLIAFTAILNIFLTRGETIWSLDLSLFTLSITHEGLIRAVQIIVRLILLLISTSVLTLTTTPFELTYAMETGMAPLRLFKVPTHEIATMMSIALRFIPTLSDEADKIIKAQKARGADLETGGLIKRARALMPILIPLFVSAFRRADELATAMDARCYNSSPTRTRMKEYHITKGDWLLCGVYTIIVALIIIMQVIL